MTKRTAYNLVAVAASFTKTGGETINAAYIPEALTKSLLILKPKRPTLLFQDWFLSWDDSPGQHPASVQESLMLKGIKIISHPPDSQAITLANIFLFPRETSSWLASCCPRTSSRQAGKGSCGPSRKMSWPLPFHAGMSAVKSALGSTLTTLRKTEK